MKKNLWKNFTLWTLIIGGLNWGVTALNFNIVQTISTALKFPGLEPIVYGLVGISAISQLVYALD